MKIKHDIILSGSNPISLDQDEQIIMDEMNSNLNRFYGNLVKVVSVSQINTDTAEFVIERDLPATHIQSGGLMNYIDESIITGMNESCFVPYGKDQAIAPILPIGKCCFSPDTEFYRLYKHLIKICTGENVKKIAITTTTSTIKMVVEFDNNVPRRYRQDIVSLISRYGDLDRMKGQIITTTLQDFSAICQRDNPKIASYDGLAKYLKKEYDITLDIKSQKTKKEDSRE